MSNEEQATDLRPLRAQAQQVPNTIPTEGTVRM